MDSCAKFIFSFFDFWKSAFENEIILESKNFIIIDFLEILISKNECKMILMIITKNYAADPEIRFSTKSILRPFGPTSPFGQRGSLILIKTLNQDFA